MMMSPYGIPMKHGYPYEAGTFLYDSFQRKGKLTLRKPMAFVYINKTLGRSYNREDSIYTSIKSKGRWHGMNTTKVSKLI